MGLDKAPDGESRLTIMTDAERRLVTMHYYLEEKKYFPWMWDYENYGEADNRDMIGFFYPEDLANLNTIDVMINKFIKEQKRIHTNKQTKK